MKTIFFLVTMEDNFPAPFESGMAMSALPAYSISALAKASRDMSWMPLLKRAEEEFDELFHPEGLHFWHWTGSPEGRNFGFLNREAFYLLIFNQFDEALLSAGGEQTRLGSHRYTCLIVPEGEVRIRFRDAGRSSCYALHVHPGLIAPMLPPGHHWEGRLPEWSGLDRITTLFEGDLPLTPHLASILAEVRHCPLGGIYREMYLKAKAIEIITLILSQDEERRAAPPQTAGGLRTRDIERMHQVREILHEQFRNPCSLIDLAHQVGTNENYLKKHFKQVFGHTVFGYIQDLRMQHARAQLRRGERNLAQVARQAGYKHTHHFVAAYKRYFGHAPLEGQSD